MVGMSEAMAAYQGLKTGFDLLQGLNAAAKGAAINDVKFKLGQHILDAQAALTAANSAQADAAETIRQLEQEIVRLKQWEGEKERYELKRYNPGSLAYSLKPDMAQGEPPHRLCANCYQQGKKAILQATHRTPGRYREHICPSCQSTFEMGEETESGPPPEAPRF